MYSTSVYYFVPRQIVVVYSGNSTRRYQLVYAKNLKLNKGVDNKIQFQYLNQEQKPYNISNLEITFRLINNEGTETLLQKSVSLTLPLTGICELTVTSAELLNIDAQMCYYSLEVRDGSNDYPTFVNSEAGARGVIQVVDSVLPSFLPATTIEIPSHVLPNANANTNVTYYSSTYSTADAAVLSIQTYLNEYSGNVIVQGSTLPDSDWYNIGNVHNYANKSGSVGYTIEGYHPYIRVEFQSTAGDVTEILAR